jgi:hypothetical protein
MQKNRNKKKIKIPTLNFGTLGLFFKHEGTIEIKHMLFIKKFLKRRLKRRDKKKKRLKL